MVGIAARPRPLDDAEPFHIDFAALVGAAGWSRLPAAVRQRFAHVPAQAEVTRYLGTMHVVNCSWVGLLIAQACRLIGTPFAPFRGADIPVEIALKRNRTGRGIVWERTYRYPNRRPIMVRSVKQATADDGLFEAVGGGFGMWLEIYEENRALHFRSLRYFWQCGPFRVPLPHPLSPGVAHVVHTDLGHGLFRFEMTIRHAWLGTLFLQDGVFYGEDDAP